MNEKILKLEFLGKGGVSSQTSLIYLIFIKDAYEIKIGRCVILHSAKKADLVKRIS